MGLFADKILYRQVTFIEQRIFPSRPISQTTQHPEGLTLPPSDGQKLGESFQYPVSATVKLHVTRQFWFFYIWFFLYTSMSVSTYCLVVRLWVVVPCGEIPYIPDGILSTMGGILVEGKQTADLMYIQLCLFWAIPTTNDISKHTPWHEGL